MNENYEASIENLDSLKDWYELNKADRNEATTRLHLIDTLLFECLGWSKNEAVLEEAYGGEYTDYTLCAPRAMLIVEAKREGDYFELPIGSTKIERSIANLSKDNPNLKSAMEQVAHYCQSRGVPFGMVTNGHQLCCFQFHTSHESRNRGCGIAPYREFR